MAWTFTDLKYGWKIAAGITLAATTIYIASNTRERVNEADIIELVLGTTERCLATQYATNPVSYYVAPPSFVRSWYSNSYETTNMPGDLVTNWYAVLHTNAFTNVIGWRTDRAMMVELDATIKALVPYYLNPTNPLNTDFSYNYLTITGLWASLGIGDRTNQFTSVPEWVGTNGVTNAATYGELPWRIYKTDLEERYKVLEALKIRPPVAPIATYTLKGWEQKTGECQTTNGYDAAKAGAISNFNVAAVQSNYPFWWAYRIEGYGKKNCLQIYKSGDWYNYYAALNATRARWTVSLSPPPYFGSNTINGKCVVLLFTEGGNIFDLHHSIDVFAGFDSGLEEINKPFLFSSNSISTGEPTLEYDTDWFGSLEVPDDWVDPPTPIEGSWALKSKGWSGKANGYYGMGNGVSKFIAYMLFDSACFSYCTNKYW